MVAAPSAHLMALNQCVKVCSDLLCVQLDEPINSYAEYKCPDLPDPTSGRVTFAPDTVAPFNLSTTSTYSCDQGFGLNGNPTRTCGSNVDNTNSEGLWSGVTPTCDCKMCLA